MEHKTIANAQKQAHLQTATSQRTDQSLQNSLLLARQKRTLFFLLPFGVLIFPIAQSTTDKTMDKIYYRQHIDRQMHYCQHRFGVMAADVQRLNGSNSIELLCYICADVLRLPPLRQAPNRQAVKKVIF